MKRLRDGTEHRHLLANSVQSDKGGLLKTGFFSLLLHMALIIFLSYSLNPAISKGLPYVYRVTIRPFSPIGDGIPQGAPSPGLPGPFKEKSTFPVGEKPRYVGDPKWNEIVEGIKPHQKKTEKKVEKSKKEERLEKEKGSRKSLQEAIDEIHKKVALDEIQKKVARREKTKKLTEEGKSTLNPSRGPILSSSKSSVPSGSIYGTGFGPGTGTGPGSTGIPTGESTGGSLWGSSVLESKLNEYYSMIWAKIKEEWTLPEDLPKGKIGLETTIVVIIDREGKVKKSWFEKRSGDALYDQMAMRAIKKAEPFPPIPKEFSDNTFEIGIRFHPD
jgi:TonB family protein